MRYEHLSVVDINLNNNALHLKITQIRYKKNCFKRPFTAYTHAIKYLVLVHVAELGSILCTQSPLPGCSMV